MGFNPFIYRRAPLAAAFDEQVLMRQAFAEKPIFRIPRRVVRSGTQSLDISCPEGPLAIQR